MAVITGSKASTEEAGVVRLATVAEAIAGVSSETAVTPAGVAAIALAGVGGVTQAELDAVQAELDTTQTGAGLAANGAYSSPAGAIYIAASTSIVNALSLIDAQLKVNADAIAEGGGALAAVDAEEARALAAEAALQGELNATQLGAGLNADGSYSAHAGSNYIDGAVDLKAADLLLDGQVKVVADAVTSEAAARAAADLTLEGDISDLQAELDATQQGAGLNADGSYTAPASNYLGATSSVLDAVNTLDTQLKIITDDIVDDLVAEVGTLTNADAALQVELDATQVGAGLEADGSLVAPVGSNYLGAISSLKDGLVALDTKLRAVEIDAGGDFTATVQELDAVELSVGLEDDGTLVAPVGTNHLGTITSIKQGLVLLDAEIKSNADTISAEAAARAAADAALTVEIGIREEEILDVITGAGLELDGSYAAPEGSNYLDAATSLKNADLLLDAQVRLNEVAVQNEAAARAAADLTLQGNIDTVEANLAAEITRAANAEAAIASDVADNTLAISTNSTAIATNATAIGVNAAAITVNETAIATNAAGILANSGDIADNALAISANEGAITALQTELDLSQASVGLNADGSLTAPVGSNYLGTITTVKQALSILDAEIKTISTASGADITDLVAEVDVIEQSVGLEGDGSFVAPLGSNYLGTIATVKGGLSTLDAQLKSLTDGLASDISDEATARAAADDALQTSIDSNAASIVDNSDNINSLQAEVDATQIAAGLEADGSFVAPASNYLGTVSSLKAGLVTLDGQLKSLTDDLASDISDETTARTLGDTSLQSELDATQLGAGLDADGGLTAPASNYLGTITTLKGGLVTLDGQIKTVADDLTSAVATINLDIAAIDLENDTLGGQITGLETDVNDLQSELDATQVGAGLNADGGFTAPVGTTHLGTITTLKAGLVALDAALADVASDLSDEVTARGLVQDELDATQLGAGLNANGSYTAPAGSSYLGATSSLKTGLSALDTALNTLQGDVTALDGELAQELLDRAAADSALQSELDATQLGAGLNANGSFTAPTSNYLAGTASLKAAASALDTQVKVNADAISAEASRAAGVESDLQDELDATQLGAGLDADGGYSAPASNYLGGTASLKAGLVALDTQLKAVADDTAATDALNVRLTTAEGEIDTLQADLLTLDGEVNAIDTRLGTAEGEIDTLQSDVVDLQSELDATQLGAGLSAAGAYAAPVGTNYLAAASSLKNADSLLDAAIKTQADAISTETSARASADTALQSELDATQLGAGLNANGSFTAPAGNYISTATTIKQALSQLDTRAKTNADAVVTEASARASADTTLQAAINSIEASVGLEADGSYTAPASNYLGATTDVVDALVALDGQVFTNESDISSIDSRVTTIENNPAVNQAAFNVLAAREGGVWQQGVNTVVYAPTSIVIRQSYGAWAYDTVNNDFIFTAPTGGPGDRHWAYDTSNPGTIIFTGVA